MQSSQQLHTDGILNDEQLKAIEQHEASKLMSVHWELRTILYLGILLLTSGIGILIYLNIDTVGHQAVLALIAAACGGCFYFSFRDRMPYSNGETKYTSPFFDYVILLGCLLFGIFVGYFQYQYNLFGNHYGLTTLFPTLVFFTCAYLFDHKGILSLGITGLAAWAGLTVTPMDLLERNDFSDLTIILTSIVLGLIIIAFAWYADKKDIKKHFSFSYNNFGMNILCIATLAALFDQDLKILSFLLLAGACYYFIRYAIAQQSLWFLLLAVIYGYIGLTYSVFSFLGELGRLDEIIFLFGTFYVMASCGGVILFFIKYKQILGIKK